MIQRVGSRYRIAPDADFVHDCFRWYGNSSNGSESLAFAGNAVTITALIDAVVQGRAAGWGWLAGLLAVALASAVATKLLMAILSARGVLDQPNARSSHTLPTPRGGGIAVLLAVAPFWIAALLTGDQAWPGLLVGAAAVALALLSFADDVYSLSTHPRLLIQLGSVGGLLAAGVLPGPALGGWLPDWLDTGFAMLAWLWFINLFNFMDGIDGIAGSETTHLAVGVSVIAAIAAVPYPGSVAGLGLGAAALGFLAWNWPPARIFMGDVGSVPIGLILGWLLLDLAARGQPAAALILPAYFLADATLTLLRRAVRRERVWQAHRTHFYQRAAAGRLGHVGVVRSVILANLALLVAAMVAAHGQPAFGIAAAIVVTSAILLLFDRAGKARGR